METSRVEITSIEAPSVPLYGIRWPAVFAGLAVGVGVHLLLMQFGIATGVLAGAAARGPDAGALPTTAELWSTTSLFIAALVGGHVAARASALRRNVDGLLHGVVAWGAAMLCFVVFAGALSASLGMAAPLTVAARGAGGTDSAMVSELLGTLERGDRATAIAVLRERFGLDQEQAARAADRALAINGRTGNASPDASAGRRDATQAAASTSAWFGTMILLSLLASAGGGLFGARAARKRALHGSYGEQRLFGTRDIPISG